MKLINLFLWLLTFFMLKAATVMLYAVVFYWQHGERGCILYVRTSVPQTLYLDLWLDHTFDIMFCCSVCMLCKQSLLCNQMLVPCLVNMDEVRILSLNLV